MVEIIAEISASHKGSLEAAKGLILAAAKESLADAVKFQCWSKDKICLDQNYVIQTGPWARRRLVDLYAEAWTPWEWFPELIEFCDDLGVPWFSSVFDYESLHFLERLGCPRYKIASFELNDTELIKACAGTGKPLILSTGMARIEEVSRAISVAHKGGCDDPILLHCISAYPAPLEEMYLQSINDLWIRFNKRVGLSDHTRGIIAPVIATAYGAVMIEKHISFEDGNGLDDEFALSPVEFGQMVKSVRQAEKSCRNTGDSPSESPQRKLRRSLYVAQDVQAGDVVNDSTVRTSRPAEGLSPDWWPKIVGMKFKQDAKRGTPVTLSMVSV